MDNPPPCEPDIFKNGTPVAWATTGPTGGNRLFESWIVRVRAASGQPVDWHYSGGRAQVLALGNLDAVRQAMNTEPLPTMVELFFFGAGEGLYRAALEAAPEKP
jgi:hypothetical protein